MNIFSSKPHPSIISAHAQLTHFKTLSGFYGSTNSEICCIFRGLLKIIINLVTHDNFTDWSVSNKYKDVFPNLEIKYSSVRRSNLKAIREWAVKCEKEEILRFKVLKYNIS